MLRPDTGSGYDPSSLIGFWPQNEAAGAISIDYSGFAHHGAYTGVTLGQPGVPGMDMTSPLYDGANDYNNIYSASLNTEFDGGEGTLLAWARVANAGVWTDGIDRRIVELQVNAPNRILIHRGPGNDRLAYFYSAGGTAETASIVTTAPLSFFPIAVTWSKIADRSILYYTGVLQATATVLGIWAGNLSNTNTVIGATSTAPAFVWSGTIGPVLLYNEEKTPAEILYLSTV